MKKEEFKKFVKENPSLIKYVNNDSMTWQKFYEMYDLYGNDKNVWSNYLDNKDDNSTSESKSTIGEFINFFKNIDLDNFQEGIQNIQRVVEMIGDISIGNDTKAEYKPRPLYKHFDD